MSLTQPFHATFRNAKLSLRNVAYATFTRNLYTQRYLRNLYTQPLHATFTRNLYTQPLHATFHCVRVFIQVNTLIVIIVKLTPT